MIRLLQPWFLAPGVLAAVIVTALHFLVRSPVRRAPLPTLRFLSPAQHSAVRLRRWPHDPLLLALRVLFALSLAAAFARPVWTASMVDRVRIVLLDRGAGMAGAWNAALDSVGTRLDDDPMVIAFDTVAVVAPGGPVDVAWLEELREAGPSAAESDYRIAFHALAREAGSVGADAYEAALVTVPRWSAFREGTASIRAAGWPGRLEVVVPRPLASAGESPMPPRVRAQPGSALFDAVEALGMTAVTDTATDAVRIIGPDSAGRSGTTRWEFVPDTAAAVDVVVFAGGWTVAAPRGGVLERSPAIGRSRAGEAPVQSGSPAAVGSAIAAWRDGAFAAVAAGDAPCIITTAFDPDQNALTASPDYPELIRHLVLGCASGRSPLAAVPLDSGAIRTLRGSGNAAVRAGDLAVPSPGRPLGTPLLLLALFCAVAEWGARRRGGVQE